MASGRGWSFGDASTDKVVLYAGLGFLAYAFINLKGGIDNALKGSGSLLGAGGNVAQAIADAINSATKASQDLVNSIKGMNPFSTTPPPPMYSGPQDPGVPAPPGTTPDPAFYSPQQQEELFPNAYGGERA